MNPKDLVLKLTRPALADTALSDEAKALYSYLVLNSVVERDCGPVVMTLKEAKDLLARQSVACKRALQALIDAGYIRREEKHCWCHLSAGLRRRRDVCAYTVTALKTDSDRGNRSRRL